MAFRQKDVLRLHVPVDYLLAVRIVECGSDLARDEQDLFDHWKSVIRQTISKRPSGDEGHDVEQVPPRFA